MSIDMGTDGGEVPDEEANGWSEADVDAAKAVERQCGISLVPDGIDD